jgi:hypothetical protein
MRPLKRASTATDLASMPIPLPSWALRPIWRLFSGLLLAGLLLILAPASAGAAITTIGSPLSVPATFNTTENLGYYGTYTPVPPNPEAPNGLFHTPHWGADTALWNVGAASGDPSVPATGQALRMSLEGCAKAAPGGPQPLTQIHFQDISPLPGGGAKVNLTSGAFDIPVCGRNGAGGSTVTSYEPINLCVSKGDYVAFNDEGGYVENFYRSGVPYQVIGLVHGSTMNSFLRGNGVGNGATMSSADTTANDGFVSNRNEELLMQVQLGTGPDATHACAGGTGGMPPPITVVAQTDGVTHTGIVAVAIYCRLSPECKGLATLTLAHTRTRVGHVGFSLPVNKTSHVPIRMTSRTLAMVRRHHGLRTTLTTVVGATTVTQRVVVKVY